MKKVIRENVFETNSSSSHAIAVKRKSESNVYKIPRNSKEIYLLEPLSICDGDEWRFSFQKLDNEESKARFLLNVIASYIDSKDDDYPEVSFWLDYEKDIVNKDRDFKKLIEQDPFIWFKEAIEEVTGTVIGFIKPEEDYFPYYDTIYCDETTILDTLSWNDKEEFKKEIKELIFDDDIVIAEANIPYGTDVYLEDFV